MIFHITHHHDATTCPAHDEEAGNATFGAVLGALEANVDRIIGAWIDPPGHHSFFVVEADEASKIFAGLWPIIPAGTAHVRPVVDLAEMMAARTALNS